MNSIKLGVKALSGRDANFITAETTIKFIIKEIQNYSPSVYNTIILEAIEERIIQQRYAGASVMITYLHNPTTELEKGVAHKFRYDYYQELVKTKMMKKISIIYM